MSSPGLYIHVPFCRSKCPYCGFFSIASSAPIPRWLAALKKEIALYSKSFGSFDSLYLGGGTPTFLRLMQLEEILDCIFAHFAFEAGTEVTIEANPGDVTIEMATGLRSLGVNRINLGVQSFDDEALLFMGRRHTAGDAERAFHNLRHSGFDNIGMDLVYGPEIQSMKRWMKTLDKALSYGPEHLSCYRLTIEKGTAFWRMKERGLLRSIEEEEEASFFMTTSRVLEAAGYIHYEISNFAREEAFCSRHNGKYWDGAPYLGLGPSAHSFQDSRRWWNFRSIKKYCTVLEQGTVPVEGDENLTEEQKRIESISLGLRTRQGIKITEIRPDRRLKGVIQTLQDRGYLHVHGEWLIPTEKGFLVADGLALQFISL